MDAVVDELVKKKSLTKRDFFSLVELHGSLKPVPPSLLDIRAAKRKQFQDMMLNQKELVSGSNLWARRGENRMANSWSLNVEATHELGLVHVLVIDFESIYLTCPDDQMLYVD